MNAYHCTGKYKKIWPVEVGNKVSASCRRPISSVVVHTVCAVKYSNVIAIVLNGNMRDRYQADSKITYRILVEYSSHFDKTFHPRAYRTAESIVVSYLDGSTASFHGRIEARRILRARKHRTIPEADVRRLHHVCEESVPVPAALNTETCHTL